jgi:hypothetical protein
MAGSGVTRQLSDIGRGELRFAHPPYELHDFHPSTKWEFCRRRRQAYNEEMARVLSGVRRGGGSLAHE